MSNRVVLIVVLILGMLAMWEVGQVIGKRVKGAPKDMATLVLPTVEGQPKRTIHITTQMKAMPNAQLFATVSVGDQLLFESVPFAMANYMDTLPSFTVIALGDLAAISTELYPENILAFVDFAKPAIWPHPTTGKPFDANDPDAAAYLQLFRDAQAVPTNAKLLTNGYMPLNNDRLREIHEASQAEPSQ